MLYRGILIIFIITLFSFASHALPEDNSRQTICWKGIQQVNTDDDQSRPYLYFEGAIFDMSFGTLPLYFKRFPVSADNSSYKFILEDLVFESVNGDELRIINPDLNYISTEIHTSSSQIIDRKNVFNGLSILPFRKNPLSGEYEKLISFNLIIQKENIEQDSDQKSRLYKEHSVLNTGKWFKISLEKTGVYHITANDLTNMGIDYSTIDPRRISLFGNGGGMLPENNSEFRYDDLIENAIIVSGEDDGVFNDDDYILFYGVSPDIWKYDTNNGLFYHIKNIYSDRTYYFLNIGNSNGKRVETEFSSIIPQTYNISKFNDRLFHEKDENNLIGSGKAWYGEVFSNVTTYDFPVFSFPDIDLSSNVTIKVNLAARSFISSTFTISATGMPSPLIANIYPVSQSQNTDFAKTKTAQKTWLPSESDIDVNITYNKSTLGSTGWLNYIELNATRNLSFSGDQMQFRNVECIGTGNISEFKLSKASSLIDVWDVTDPLNPKYIDAIIDNTEMSFRLATDSLREFIAFNSNFFYEIEFVGEIENQDLHAIDPTDIIIVSHPDFLDEAKRLADLHLLYDNFTSCIVTPEQIYNEFSSGRLDVTAIRDFVKMLYDNASIGSEPKYLLLFGDGSYDNKNILNTNSNFIPTYQSFSSLLSTSTFVSDDFFGLLDNGEGYNANGSIDIGIGRLPVQTLDQARAMVDKIEYYMTPSDSGDVMPGEVAKFGDWRNIICFVADDEDGNLHFNQAEYLAKSVENSQRSFNVDKIYLDAYPQISTPGGDRYPEVNSAINERMKNGSLLVNYIGHGGEQGWAYENVLEIIDINNWDNYASLPAFLTATCEFSRYDDPRHTTAGELVILNPKGGGISIFSTTRVAFASSNFSLTVSLYDHLFEKTNNEYWRLGDLIRLSKNDNNNDATIKNFVLLGDPALRLNYPDYSVVTSKINNEDVSAEYDTLKALEQITISGYIADQNENIIPGFNGVIYPVIFDKASEITTLDNDNDNASASFKLQNRILYKGRASVSNGEFSFSFVMPKDINYNYGEGKVSYYSENGDEDAHGYYDGIIIGGTDNDINNDNSGPDINLYMDNLNFVSGGLTNHDPVFIAYLFDENGINAFGNGIGHEIVAVLDGETGNSIALNTYFEPDIDTYQSGKVIYPFYGLSEGMHQLKLKAWDMLNNSSEAYIDFYVTSTDRIDLNYIMNYPNPFMDVTHFYFDHNQAGKELDVKLQIYTISGAQVLSKDFSVITEEYNTEFYIWDGKGDNGNILSNGLYVYRIIVQNSEGYYDAASQKLVILK